ncbi:hypothetical protein GCM10010253_33090 [Streptomyces badius]|uniref:Uncharacterized protein n=1 Tax=Streptomyces badius TaxID=1941 RepID=A0ABQ2T776_STRBA|nr:hypothetical protein GCM10010253_33090 [Streptomyces badius]
MPGIRISATIPRISPSGARQKSSDRTSEATASPLSGAGDTGGPGGACGLAAGGAEGPEDSEEGGGTVMFLCPFIREAAQESVWGRGAGTVAPHTCAPVSAHPLPPAHSRPGRTRRRGSGTCRYRSASGTPAAIGVSELAHPIAGVALTLL